MASYRSRSVATFGVIFLVWLNLVAADVRPISSVLPFRAPAATRVDPQKLVEPPPIVLTYHNGPLLTGPRIPVYIIWYGRFSPVQKRTLTDFFGSFGAKQQPKPSVSSWWKITSGYKSSTGASVSPNVKVLRQVSDAKYSKGKSLKNTDLEALVVESLKLFPADSSAIYFVFTSSDVEVEDFCMNSCASHFNTAATAATKNKQLVYAWVGNPGVKCPGLCAWPYAKPQYGPPNPPLSAPNGDVGVEGMVINTAIMVAGAATNPLNTGYYQGDAGYPYESATACAGIYGANAYPGFPGILLVDNASGASYNALGINNRKYLLPALWNPADQKCTPP